MILDLDRGKIRIEEIGQEVLIVIFVKDDDEYSIEVIGFQRYLEGKNDKV